MTARELAAVPDLPSQAGPVNVMSVKRWERSGCPVAERGRKGKPSLFVEADVRAWLQGREDSAKTGELVDVAHERARKEHWQAKLAEQTHAARERKLLPVEEVERAWGAGIAAVRTKLLSLPITLSDRIYRAGTLHGLAGVEAALDAAMRDTLREIAGGAEAEPKAKKRAQA